ncbi:MAG: FKBP-type peptidyl-prolyl cis-trans isomerase [Omnitrophica WOR_2 bacterium]
MYYSKNIFLLFIVLLMAIGCKKEDDFKAVDDKIINNYLKEENLTAHKTESGLYYIINSPGVFPKPSINSRVTVHYTGYLTTHKVFETTEGGDPVTFKLTDVIEGWQEGLQLFGTGGSGILLIPSHLGYGSTIMPGIPANSVLIFDIRLIKVE